MVIITKMINSEVSRKILDGLVSGTLVKKAEICSQTFSVVRRPEVTSG